MRGDAHVNDFAKMCCFIFARPQQQLAAAEEEGNRGDKSALSPTMSDAKKIEESQEMSYLYFKFKVWLVSKLKNTTRKKIHLIHTHLHWNSCIQRYIPTVILYCFQVKKTSEK
jgi:hypothetical protein